MTEKLPESQNQQLADHIKKNLTKGYTLDSIKYSLLAQNYSRTTVEKAIEMAQKQLAAEVPKMQEKPVVRYMEVDDDEMKRRIAEQDDKIGFFTKLKRKIFG